MEVKVTTVVNRKLADVRLAFSKPLLEKLNPPFPKAQIVRYDGESVGDEVWISLNFLFFKQLWKSKIIESHEDEYAFVFKDQGVQLPFFLKSWQHTHALRAAKGGTATEITDALQFTTPWWLPRILAQPVFTALMLYRRPLYKRYLGAPHSV